jgi:hypothetical protein
MAFLNSMHESVSTSDLTPDDKVRAVQLGTAKLAEQLGLKVDVGPFGAAEVGQRVRVYWDGEQRHFWGTVADFNPTTGSHQIAYDDGDRCWEKMAISTHELAGEADPPKKRPRQQLEQGARAPCVHRALDAGPLPRRVWTRVLTLHTEQDVRVPRVAVEREKVFAARNCA